MRDGLVFVCKRERWKEWVCVPCWATPSSPHLDNGPGVQETRRQQWDSTILTSIYHFMDEPLNQKATKRLSSRPWGGGGQDLSVWGLHVLPGSTWVFSGCPGFLPQFNWLLAVNGWPDDDLTTQPGSNPTVHKGNVFRRMDECDATQLLWNLMRLDQPGVYFPPWIFFQKTTWRCGILGSTSCF